MCENYKENQNKSIFVCFFFFAENLSTEKEVQLYTELLATKVALKASQDKLEQYAKEKLRFIESIEQLVRLTILIRFSTLLIILFCNCTDLERKRGQEPAKYSKSIID